QFTNATNLTVKDDPNNPNVPPPPSRQGFSMTKEIYIAIFALLLITVGCILLAVVTKIVSASVRLWF
ncbi:1757_t:CDS:1, partial [Paraglomus brasilianum]